MNNCLFDESNNALKNLTELYDIIWPLSVSVWKTRCEIKGMLIENPNLKDTDFAKLFNVGSGIHGVNYKKNFAKKTWDEQKGELAIILLNHSIAIFEGWIDSIVKLHFPVLNSRGIVNEFRTKERIKNIQFPHSILGEVCTMVSDQSSFMVSNLYNKYRALKKRDYSKIEQYLYCFRVYKELRNSYMHSGSVVTPQLVMSKQQYCQNVLSPNDLSSSYLPDFSWINNIGDSLFIKLEDAVFLTDIIIKIVLSIDSELSKSKAAEQMLINRFKCSSFYNSLLKYNPEKRRKQFERFFLNGLKTPIPDNVTNCEYFFIDNNLVTI